MSIAVLLSKRVYVRILLAPNALDSRLDYILYLHSVVMTARTAPSRDHRVQQIHSAIEEVQAKDYHVGDKYRRVYELIVLASAATRIQSSNS